MSRATRSAGALAAEMEDFWLICTLLVVAMSRKSSVSQLSKSVSGVLTADIQKQLFIRWSLAGAKRSASLTSS